MSWTHTLPRTRTILVTLLAGDLVLLLGHVLVARHEIFGELFDLDQEANLPTWYSSLKFVLAAAAAAACYLSESTGDEAQRPRYRAAWRLFLVPVADAARLVAAPHARHLPRAAARQSETTTTS